MGSFLDLGKDLCRKPVERSMERRFHRRVRVSSDDMSVDRIEGIPLDSDPAHYQSEILTAEVICHASRVPRNARAAQLF